MHVSRYSQAYLCHRARTVSAKRASPRPSTNRAAAALWSAHCRHAEGSAAFERLQLFPSRLLQCTAQLARAVHCSAAFALSCDAEARREPSTPVSSFFRKSLPFPLGMPIWRCNASLAPVSRHSIRIKLYDLHRSPESYLSTGYRSTGPAS